MTENIDGTEPQSQPKPNKGFSPALLIAGLAALAVAFWGAVGGPNLISAGTLLAIVGIVAVAVAGIVLIRPRTARDSRKPTVEGTSPGDR